jgi:uncharacterized membrane protein
VNPTGISADGSAVIGNAQFPQDGTRAAYTRAFVWTYARGMTLLEPLTGATSSAAAVLSADGRVIAGTSLQTTPIATRWVADSDRVFAPAATSLGVPANDTQSSVSLISQDGSVILGVSSDAVTQRAYRWTQAAGARALNMGAQGSAVRLVGMSADAAAVVGEVTPADGSVPAFSFLWRGSSTPGWLSKLAPATGDSSARVTAISGNAKMVIGVSTPSSGTPNGVFWVEGTGLPLPLETSAADWGCVRPSLIPGCEALSFDGTSAIAQRNGSAVLSDNQLGLRQLETPIGELSCLVLPGQDPSGSRFIGSCGTSPTLVVWNEQLAVRSLPDALSAFGVDTTGILSNVRPTVGIAASHGGEAVVGRSEALNVAWIARPF